MTSFLQGLWDELRHEPGMHKPREIGPFNALISLVMVLVWLLDEHWRPQLPGALVSGGCVAVSVGCLLLLIARRDRLGRWEARTYVVLMGAVSLVPPALGAGDGGSWAVAFGLALSIVLSSRLGLFGLGSTIVLGVAALIVLVLRITHEPVAVGAVALGIAWMFVGPLMGQRSRRVMREQAAGDERARLAREVHDVLAHTLSALSVQLEGARMLLEERPGDPRALAIMSRAQRLVAAGLAETGQAVAALRGDVPRGPEALRRLAEEFELESGIACRFEVEGTPAPLSAEASLALYRGAQEALTNVRKHAAATDVTVRLRYGGHGAELTVEDRGETKPSLASSGYGLTGIRERTELLGGRLDAGPTPDGFRVRLSVPA